MRKSPLSRSLPILLILPFFLLSNLVYSQTARRALNTAIGMEEEGSHEQALSIYERLINGDQDEEVTLLARIRAGTIYLNQKQDYAQAQQFFESVVSHVEYSELASEALFNLGEIRYQQARTLDEIQDALGEFRQAIEIYGDTSAALDSLMFAGMIEENMNNLSRAVFYYQTAFYQYPESELASQAQFRLARCYMLMGEIGEALEELQKVRLNYPQSPEDRMSLDASSSIYRLFYSNKITELYRQSAITTPQLDNPTQIEFVSDGNLLLLDKNRVLTIGVDEKTVNAGRSNSASIFVDREGRVHNVTDRAIRSGAQNILVQFQDKDDLKVFDKIKTFVQNSFGEGYVAGDKDGIWGLQLQGRNFLAVPLPWARIGKVARLRVDSRGALYALDQDRRLLNIVDRDGTLLKQINAKSYGIDRIQNFTIDFFDNLYLLNRDGGFVVLQNLYSAEDKLAALARVPTTVKKPKTIGVDHAGRVYVAGEKNLESFS